MFQYTLKRLFLLVVTLFGITVLTFVLTRLTPGDPAALKIQSAGSMGQAVGGYKELVELNRRNLGLDKPMLLNFEFTDRTSLAHQAITDLFKRAEYWHEDGQRRLLRQSTIALKPALDRYATIGTADEFPHEDEEDLVAFVSPEERKERLASLLPLLAAQPIEDQPERTPDESFRYWTEWYEDHRERFADDGAANLVAEFVSVENENRARVLQDGVAKVGGFAVPYLIDHLESGDHQKLRRVNRALSRQTGLNFLVSEENLEERADEVVARWRSWWRREHMAFESQSPLSHGLNIFRNTQFGLWVVQAATFDFGDSYVAKKPVNTLVARALPVSLILSGISILLSYLLAIPIGIFSAIKRHTAADKLITIILFILYSLPSFWVAGLLLLTTTGEPFLSLFPTRGLHSEGIRLGAEGISFGQWAVDALWHMVLPVICLTYGSLAFISRQMRSAMLETINQDFIRTAQAKGLSSTKVIFKHALRNSLIPILTISAGLLPELIGGAVIIESIFTIPGMGTLTFEAIVNRDYPVVNAVLFFSAFLTLLGILLTDLSYAFVDPRISYD